MSRTDKDKPSKFQIKEQREVYGENHIDYHEVTWRRYKGHGKMIQEEKHRKDSLYSVEDGYWDWEDERCLRCGDDLSGLAHPHNCRGPVPFDWEDN